MIITFRFICQFQKLTGKIIIEIGDRIKYRDLYYRKITVHDNLIVDNTHIYRHRIV